MSRTCFSKCDAIVSWTDGKRNRVTASLNRDARRKFAANSRADAQAIDSRPADFRHTFKTGVATGTVSIVLPTAISSNVLNLKIGALHVERDRRFGRFLPCIAGNPAHVNCVQVWEDRYINRSSLRIAFVQCHAGHFPSF
jgi:hypothetical protein